MKDKCKVEYVKHKCVDYYNGIAKGYDELYGLEQIEKYRFVKKIIDVDIDWKILDVGCGTGLSKDYFHAKWYGVEPAKELINQSKYKEKIKEGFGENIPYNNEEFDCVISFTAIQNFSDIHKGIKEIKRVCKSEGLWILTSLKKSDKTKIIKEEIQKIFSKYTIRVYDQGKDIVWIIEK